MRLLDQKKSEELLTKYKIPIVKSQILKSRDEISKVKLNFPLVLKALSEKIVHKTDAGGVIINIQNKAELKQKILEIEKNVFAKFGKIVLDFLIQEQVCGKELIIGMKRDLQFGPVILFGLGGVFVEVFKDVSMRIAPITKVDAVGMIDEIKSSKILKGYRGDPSVKLSAIVDILLKISELSIKEKHIFEIDFNPVMINEKKAYVVDARMLVEDK